MKRAIIYILAIINISLLCTPVVAQNKREVKFRGAYYTVRRDAHNSEKMPSKPVIFLGNSITEQGWWEMLFKNKKIVNRGIGGDNTFGMLDRLPEILAAEPQKIFFMGGVNDLTAGLSCDTIVYNIRQMIIMTKERVPSCTFVVQSVLPINDSRLAYPAIKGKNPKIVELNSKIEEMCREQGVLFLNVAPLLSNSQGELKADLTKDGIHLYPAAYRIWSSFIKKNRLLK